MAASLTDPDVLAIGRPFRDIENVFEQAICQALYDSVAQRRHRAFIVVGLGIKHGLRGILFSWPLYMIGMAALVMPGEYTYLLALFLLPGLWVSARILHTGVREDFYRYVDGVILRPGAWRHILFKLYAP